MRNMENSVVAPDEGRGGGSEGGRPTEQAVFHVNTDHRGRVAPRGEDLTGREILSRVGLSAEKYELWTVVDGQAGEEIKPDDTRHVKPGDHFRATIRGTDYSSPGHRLV